MTGTIMLRTRCGCQRTVEVTDLEQSRIYLVPLKPKISTSISTSPPDPDQLTYDRREFERTHRRTEDGLPIFEERA